MTIPTSQVGKNNRQTIRRWRVSPESAELANSKYRSLRLPSIGCVSGVSDISWTSMTVSEPADQTMDETRKESVPQIGELESLCALLPIPHLHPVLDDLRHRIRLSHMNQYDKWRLTGRVPWKWALQVIKITLVIIHLFLYASVIQVRLQRHSSSRVALKEHFLPSVNLGEESMPYPPSFPDAFHTRDDFYERLNFAITAYAKLEKQSLGAFGYLRHENSSTPIPAKICIHSHKFGEISPDRRSFNVSSERRNDCISIDPLKWHNRPIQEHFKIENVVVNFPALIEVEMTFPIREIYVNCLEPDDLSECFDTTVHLTFERQLHSDRITSSVRTSTHQTACNETVDKVPPRRPVYLAMSITVLILSSISCLFSASSIVERWLLQRETDRSFRIYFHRPLNRPETLFFADLWLFVTILSDCLTIAGTAIKILLEQRVYGISYIPWCTALLSLGNFFVFVALCRYLNFFEGFNVMFVCLKRCTPELLRFSISVLLVFFGFATTGYAMFANHHIKFSSFSSTCEIIFSLTSGDEVYDTFENLRSRGDVLTWYLFRLYMYSFMVCFYYIIFSMIVSILIHTFEDMQDYFKRNFVGSPGLANEFAPSDFEVRNCYHFLVSTTTNLFLL